MYLMDMNIKPNRSQGLLGYRLEELGTVCQTQSSMIESVNAFKSMGNFKNKSICYTQGYFSIHSTFPISLDLQPYTHYY